ncbi:MAG: hypothetical protein L0271_11215 [Gemmatimonadetes bacterium]|nr:hypothetical protein [Gemmatimonadota bacterium]
MTIRHRPIARGMTRSRHAAAVAALACVMALTSAHGGVVRWGLAGHRITGLAAASTLPDVVPEFFRAAVDQLGWLNYEPDRWRADAMVEANEAFRYDHYVDLEHVSPAARQARDRFEYLSILQRDGLARPARDGGLLAFHILELHQRLTIGFSQWRKSSDARERRWIEQRIINDAGILGHYAADAANPHHTTIHHNGWADGAPNPNGYTTERDFHARFEAEFVGAHATLEDVVAGLGPEVRRLADPRADTWAFILSSHSRLETLYQLEKRARFSATTRSASHLVFATERLAAGADFLRSLWLTAWLNSESL